MSDRSNEITDEIKNLNKKLIENKGLFEAVMGSVSKTTQESITNLNTVNDLKEAYDFMNLSLLKSQENFSAVISSLQKMNGLMKENCMLGVLSAGMNSLSALSALAHSKALDDDNSSLEKNNSLLKDNILKNLLSSGVSLINSAAVKLNSISNEGLNKTLKESAEAIERANSLLLSNSLLSLLASAGNLIRKSMLESETKAISKNTEALGQNNAKAVAQIGLKAFNIGLGIGGPAGLVIGPTAALAATGVALGINEMASAALASGGIVSSPTLALIGEGRYPEAVVPLGESPQFKDMKDQLASAVLAGLASLNGREEGEEININIDGDRLARLIMPKIKKESLRRGINFNLGEV